MILLIIIIIIIIISSCGYYEDSVRIVVYYKCLFVPLAVGHNHFPLENNKFFFISLLMSDAAVSPPGVVACGCTDEVSGMLHRDIRPAESPWISSLWKGSLRPKKKRVTGGQISSWEDHEEVGIKRIHQNLE